MLLLELIAKYGPPPSCVDFVSARLLPCNIAHAPIDPSRGDAPRGRLLVAIVIAVVAGLITHGTFAGSGDEPHYLVIAHSIAYDGDLDLANDYQDIRLIAGGNIEPGAHAVMRDGRLRPVHDIGMPLALSPLIWAVYQHAGQINRLLPAAFKDTTRLNEAIVFRHFVSLMMAVLTGLLAREMFLLLRDFGATSASAFWWALLFAMAPPVLSHSFLFFTETPSALITLFVVRRLCLKRLESPLFAALLGGLAGYLLLIHIRNVGIVAGLLAIAVLHVRDRRLALRPFAAFVAGVAAAAVARTVVTYALWGTYVTTPHGRFAEVTSIRSFAVEIFERLTGLLFDRDFGLIAYAPIYLLAGAGLVMLWQRRPPFARDLSLVLAGYLIPVLLPFTNPHGWRGGWSPAARFLLPVVALLWVGVYTFATHSGRWGRRITVALIVAQIAMSAFVWQHPKMLWKDDDGSILFPGSQWLPAWTDPNAMPWFVAALAAYCAASFLLSSRRYARS